MRRTGLRNRLSDLINQLDWQTIKAHRVLATKLCEDEVNVQFFASKKTPDLVNKVRIRIGQQIIKELGWNYKDRILPSFYPDDHLLFLLCKGGNGYSVAKDAGSTSGSLIFTWTNLEIPLEPMRPTKVDFEVWEGKLVLRAAPQSNMPL
jgi:hypothetical protein